MKEADLTTFKKLEKWLIKEGNENKCLIVYDMANQITAIMHVFFENFSNHYQSGDGILFYKDGETHSANPDDKFRIIRIISF